jgi:hypothetical protein
MEQPGNIATLTDGEEQLNCRKKRGSSRMADIYCPNSSGDFTRLMTAPMQIRMAAIRKI